jgi:hypothetical protein
VILPFATVIFTWTIPYPTSTALPVKVPLTALLAGAAVVGAAAGVVAVVVDFEVCVAAAFALFVGVDVGFAFVVATALVVGALDAVGASTGAGIAAPTEPLAEEVAEICGGVIARTAPRPPTVPPAINNERFMPLLSLAFLRSN